MAEEQPTKPKRRIIKKVETVREKVEKNASAAAKPKKERGVVGLTLYYISWPFRMIGRGIKKIGRYIIPSYFKKSWAELKQVSWPNWHDSWRLTVAVIIFSAVFGALITVVDYGLDKLFRQILIN